MKEYLQSSEEVLSALTTTENGLSGSEAQSRLEKNGKNKLVEGKKTPMIVRFFQQFAEPMTIILLVAAVISGVMAIFENEFPADVIIIMAVVVINAVLGVLQESKAEKAIAALQDWGAGGFGFGWGMPENAGGRRWLAVRWRLQGWRRGLTASFGAGGAVAQGVQGNFFFGRAGWRRREARRKNAKSPRDQTTPDEQTAAQRKM